MPPTVSSESPTADLLERLSGTALGSERLREVVTAYAPIFEAIARLRELDLRDVHPAVLFEPTAPYRAGAMGPAPGRSKEDSPPSARRRALPRVRT